MGLGFKGDTGHHHSISENLDTLKNDYGFHDGYFGNQSSSNPQSDRRNIISDDPMKTAKDFYDKIAHGGVEKELDNGKGFMASMSDGTIITWRPVSSSKDKSPAVDINIIFSKDHGGIKQQKIHFVKGK